MKMNLNSRTESGKMAINKVVPIHVFEEKNGQLQRNSVVSKGAQEHPAINNRRNQPEHTKGNHSKEISEGKVSPADVKVQLESDKKSTERGRWQHYTH